MRLRIKKQGLLKIILGFSAASWISAVLNFIILPISTRLFEPGQLARINLFYAAFTMVTPFACFGLDQGYIRFFNDQKTEDEKRNLLSVCMTVSVFVLIAVAIIATPFRNDIAVWISDTENSIIVLLLLICALNALVLRYISLLHRMKNTVVLFTITSVCSSAVVKISYLGAVLYDAQYYTAILCMACTSLIFLMVTLYTYRKSLNFKAPIKRILTPSILQFSIPLMPISVMALLNNNIPLFLLRRLDNLSQLGVYTSAVTLAGIITLLQSGLNVFWSPYVYKNYENEINNIRKMHKVIVFVMVAFAILIIAFQDVIVLLLGESYREITAFLPFLLISPVSYTIAETTGVGIALEKKSYVNLLIYTASVTINIIACCILIPLYSAGGAAIASAIAASLMLILKTIFGQKYYRSVGKYRYAIVGMIFLLIVTSTNMKLNNNVWLCLLVNSLALIGLCVFFNLKAIIKSALVNNSSIVTDV